MKRLTMTLLFLAFIAGYQAQVKPVELKKPVATSLQEYETMKKQGLQPIMAPGIYSNDKIIPIIQPGHKKTLQPGDCDCLQELDETFSIVPFSGALPPEYRNDDLSSGLISLPFTFCLYGDNYTSCYINNNGNVSFGAPYGTFTANPFPDASYVMVAPFWADVDTQGAGSGLVHYKITDHSLTVIWDNVGYFPSSDDLLNTFQLVITDGEDPIVPFGNNTSFCYGDMQWTTGAASGGIGGFGGSAATVGANAGDGVAFIQLGQFDAPGINYDGPFGNPDQVSWLDDQTFIFNTCDGTGNVPPLPSGAAACDTLIVCAGGELEITLNFYAPEQDQTCSVTVDSDLTGVTVVSNTPGINAEVVLNIVTSEADAGLHYITFTATDDGEPVATTVVEVPVIVQIFDLIPPEITGDSTYCEGTNGVTLTLANGPYDAYDWSTGANTPSINGALEGEYSCVVQDGLCFLSASYDVSMIVIPDTVFVPDTLEICWGSHPTLIGPEVPYPATYEWTYLQITPEGPVPVVVSDSWGVVLGEPGLYWITITDSQCGFQVDKDYLIIGESCNVYVPNIFTPNSDGENDFLEFEGLGNFPNSTLKVFNRWGNLVFESTNYNNKWSGDDYPEGTYFFILGINNLGDMEYREGNVTLVRDTK